MDNINDGFELFDLDVQNNQSAQDNLSSTSSDLKRRVNNPDPMKAYFDINSLDKKDRGLTNTELKHKKAATTSGDISITSVSVGIILGFLGLASCSYILFGLGLAAGVFAMICGMVSLAHNAAVDTKFEFCQKELPTLQQKAEQKLIVTQGNKEKFKAQITEASENLENIKKLLDKNETEKIESFIEKLGNNEVFCCTVGDILLQEAEAYYNESCRLQEELKKTRKSHYEGHESIDSLIECEEKKKSNDNHFVLRVYVADDMLSEDQNIRENAIKGVLRLDLLRSGQNQARMTRDKTSISKQIDLVIKKINKALEELEQPQSNSNERSTNS